MMMIQGMNKINRRRRSHGTIYGDLDYTALKGVLRPVLLQQIWEIKSTQMGKWVGWTPVNQNNRGRLWLSESLLVQWDV
jgi:hypothetical protein